MKTFRVIGMAMLAVLLCVSFASCDKDDDSFENPKDESEVDFTNHTPTDLKINGETFWYRYDYNCFTEHDWGGGDKYIGFLFSGKTSNMVWARFGLHESEISRDFLNSNENIAQYVYFMGGVKDGDYLRYKYSYGRISIRIDNGVFKLNFNNVVFKNDEIGDTRTINGTISYQL
ncbi:MAG: hypothetical protein II278_02945 [Bacteroidaceae bacterium]|nr:hypothetical protein [Bacteroidaceae bacterium]